MRPDPGRDRADVEHAFDADLRSLNAADVELASQVWLQSPAPPRALGGSGESCIREEDQTVEDREEQTRECSLMPDRV